MTRKCTRRPKIYGQKFWLSQRYGHIWFLIVGFNNSRLIAILKFDFDFVRFYQFFRYRFFHDFDSENCLKNDFISISIPKKYVRIADSSILVRIDPALVSTVKKDKFLRENTKIIIGTEYRPGQANLQFSLCQN